MIAPVNVEDFRRLTRKRLPAIVFDYLDGGAEDEHGIEHNKAIFQHIRFKPLRLRNVSERDLSTSLLGRPLAAPLLIAPTGLNGLLWPEGDIALARAAAGEGLPFILSTASNASIEDVARQVDGDLWFQLYTIHADLTRQLIRRAIAADYSTLVVTVDVVVNGNRERDRRNGFAFPLRFSPGLVLDGIRHPRWLWHLLRNGLPRMANMAQQQQASLDLQTALLRRQMDASFDWSSLARLRETWPRRLLVKGILRAEDAQRCVELGADGVILSNHGARQLDHCISPMQVLGQVVENISQPVLVDSGFRRGSDVVKALAMGASGILIGRAVLYGLAARGEAGAREVLRLLKREMDITLAQIGCPSVAQLSPEYLL
ncbi:alpha-hydroxy-acid oxidizing protein [Dyella choica]|uniref:Mandelate dehydrogenase n=1 Tax=Dyella choica TaxID=1927959 RepID=A0A432LZM5_9GAMM|nr:alpha-hydroxy-acid oxidizing protein [Dyella choica]RUL69270.1 mandelate dehydrogenase [Dyella choica]